jgi:hypothetical protein
MDADDGDNSEVVDKNLILNAKLPFFSPVRDARSATQTPFRKFAHKPSRNPTGTPSPCVDNTMRAYCPSE